MNSTIGNASHPTESRQIALGSAAAVVGRLPGLQAYPVANSGQTNALPPPHPMLAQALNPASHEALPDKKSRASEIQSTSRNAKLYIWQSIEKVPSSRTSISMSGYNLDKLHFRLSCLSTCQNLEAYLCGQWRFGVKKHRPERSDERASTHS